MGRCPIFGCLINIQMFMLYVEIEINYQIIKKDEIEFYVFCQIILYSNLKMTKLQEYFNRCCKPFILLCERIIFLY